MKNFLKLLSITFLLTISTVFAKDAHVVSDTEGSSAKIQAMVDQGKMKWITKNGQKRLDFVNSTDSFVFLGDLSGPNWQDGENPQNIFLREVFSDLKKTYPDRFDFIWGNHEANRFGFIRENIRMARNEHPEYKKYLQESGLPDSTENRVFFWGRETYGTDQNGVAKPVAEYQKELSNRLRREVSVAEASDEFAKDLKVGKPGEPHGKMLDLLTKGQESAYRNGFAMTHAPIRGDAAGLTPLEGEKHAGGASWLKHRNENYFRKEIESFITAAQKGEVPSSILPDTGDARWDSVARRVVNDGHSLSYTERGMIGDQYVGIEPSVAKRLADDKDMPAKGLITGHKPAGNYATVHRQQVGASDFFDVVADTSRGAQGAASTVTIKPDGSLNMSGQTTEGKLQKWTVNSKSDPMIGKVLEDGFHIKGETRDGHYIMERYEGYGLKESVVPKSEVDTSKAAFSYEDASRNKVSQAKEAALESAINSHGGQVLAGTDEAARVVGDRFVLDLRGASKWAAVDEAKAAEISAQLKEMAQEMDPKKVVILTGGNRAPSPNAVENMVHDIFHGDRATGKFDIIGFMKHDTPADEVDKSVKYVVKIGDGNNWDGPVNAAHEFMVKNKGASVMWGGGGVLERALNSPFVKNFKNRFYLMQGYGGASEKFALNGTSIRSTKELIQKVSNAVRASEPKMVRARGASERIGVYAGSFDPPHAGHKKIVEQMKARYGLDTVYIVPDKVTTYKPGMLPLEDREAMIRKMFSDPGIKVMPADLTGKGELWDVLKAAKSANPKSKVYGIMGTDTFDWFKNQPDAKALTGYGYLVNNRDPNVKIPKSFQLGQVEMVDLGDEGFSSSKVREALARGERPKEVPEEVLNYIEEKKLYLAKEPAAVDPSDVVKKERIASEVADRKPQKISFIKDQPVIGYKIVSDKFEDIPEPIRKHLGSVDKTTYTPEYLKKNEGSVFALQMNGEKPDFYVIGKESFAKYAPASLEDVQGKNGKYYDRLKQQIPDLIAGKDPKLVGILKTTPTEMVKMSDLGFSRDKTFTIESPWGTQTKPAGKEGYLVFDESKGQHYLVNVGDDEIPLSYRPVQSSRMPASVAGTAARLGSLDADCASGTIESIVKILD